MLVAGEFRSREGIDYRSSCEFTTLTRGRARFSFLGRSGGVSEAPYDSLNLSTAVGDDDKAVEDNYERMQAVFGLRSIRPVTVNQVHGKSVFIAGEGSHDGVEADAIITDTPGLPIGVLTADCLPILLFDPEVGVAAVVHAGWRGTVKGVAVETVIQMERELGADAERIVATFGPHIAPCCYKVGPEVINSFTETFGRMEGKMVYGEGGGEGGREGRGEDDGALWFDLARANSEALMSVGVRDENMVFDFACTSCEEARLFSHRRDKGLTGRQLSFIMVTR